MYTKQEKNMKVTNWVLGFTIVVITCCFTYPICSIKASEAIEWNIYKEKVLQKVPQLEGWCSQEKASRMMELIVKTSPEVFVEVGVFGGSSFLPTVAAMRYNQKGLGYAIDPWKKEACLEGNQGVNYEWWSRINLDMIMNGFIQKMRENGLNQYYQLMRMTSKEALGSFTDGSIDILHIDGNHSEESALFDATHWLSKVRSGGYIWFDDANWVTTKKAVEYLCSQCELDPSSNLQDPYLLFRKR